MVLVEGREEHVPSLSPLHLLAGPEVPSQTQDSAEHGSKNNGISCLKAPSALAFYDSINSLNSGV